MKQAKRMVAITEEEYQELKRIKKKSNYIEAVKYKQALAQKLNVKQKAKSTIDGYFEPKHQSRVKNLMDELNAIGVKVNSRRELQLPYGDTIAHSDIVMLLKELLVGSTLSRNRPIGWDEFINVVAKSAIPSSMISKGAAKKLVEDARRDRLILDWEEY